MKNNNNVAFIVNKQEAKELRELAQELRQKDDRLAMWVVGVCERNLRDYCETTIVER